MASVRRFVEGKSEVQAPIVEIRPQPRPGSGLKSRFGGSSASARGRVSTEAFASSVSTCVGGRDTAGSRGHLGYTRG